MLTESESQQFETIRTYLNSSKKSYQQGVLLLKLYYPDQHKVSSLERFQNDFLLDQLMNELYDGLKAKMNASMQPVPSIQEITSIAIPVVKPVKVPKPKSGDLRKLEEIKKARTLLYKERAAFHKEMGDIAFNDSGSLKPLLLKHEIERRHELAKQVMSHTVEIDKYWTIQDYYEAHNTFPSQMRVRVPKPVQLSNAEALRKLLNIRTTITKTTKKINDGKTTRPHLTGKPLEKLKKQLAEWDAKLKIAEAEKSELEAQIGKKPSNERNEQEDN